MIRYRPFRNTDPPLLAELWCTHPPLRALVQPMTVGLLEQKVLSKPYFDRLGLIVAEEGQRLSGFVHAGFGANSEGSALATETGATCMLMVAPHAPRREIAGELLRRSEEYLLSRGARRLLAGSVYPANPFYLGLYGDNHSPGVLESDAERVQLFRDADYEMVQQQVVLEQMLGGFRPLVDRLQMQLRRQYLVQAEVDPTAANWWEACTEGQTSRVRFLVASRRTGQICGWTTFWDMERISTSRGVLRAAGMLDLNIVEDGRGQGLATFLMGEALRRLQGEQTHLHEPAGFQIATVQFDQDNLAALALFKKLGFHQVDRGLVLRKSRPPA